MFNNIFCEMKGKKVVHWGGPGGMGKRGKVYYGQEPPSRESTTTECGFDYQLLAVIY